MSTIVGILSSTASSYLVQRSTGNGDVDLGELLIAGVVGGVTARVGLGVRTMTQAASLGAASGVSQLALGDIFVREALSGLEDYKRAVLFGALGGWLTGISPITAAIRGNSRQLGAVLFSVLNPSLRQTVFASILREATSVSGVLRAIAIGIGTGELQAGERAYGNVLR